MQAQPLGEVAREVMGENELWLAMALTHAALQVLKSAHIMQSGPYAPSCMKHVACPNMHLLVACVLGNSCRDVQGNCDMLHHMHVGTDCVVQMDGEVLAHDTLAYNRLLS